jgi:hypothetical protein
MEQQKSVREWRNLVTAMLWLLIARAIIQRFLSRRYSTLLLFISNGNTSRLVYCTFLLVHTYAHVST